MKPDILQYVQTLAAQQAILRAELKAVRRFLQRTTDPSIRLDQLTAEAWIVREKHAELQRDLIALEDRDPALAAKLQQLMGG